MPRSLDVAIEIELDEHGAIKRVKGLDKSLRGLKPASEKATSGMGKLKKAIGGLGLALAARQVQRFASDTVRAFADYEREAINVQNITGMTSKEMKILADEILNLPPALGQSTDLMKGLYQALSAGVPEDNAIEFLVENAKAAKGNLADLTTTVSASSSVLAAYGLDVSETTNVLDAMTKTVDLGKLTFEDLSANIGKGISIAAQAGVSYQELMATLATLTMSGLSVEESMTGIRNILVATIKPQTEQIKMMEELGVEMSLSALKAQGLGGFMATLAEAVDGNAQATAGLFPNIRALNSAMSLTSEVGGARLLATIDAINDSAGKVEENFERMAKSTAEQIEQMLVSWNKLKIFFGEELSPAVALAADGMKKFTFGLLVIKDAMLNMKLDKVTRDLEYFEGQARQMLKTWGAFHKMTEKQQKAFEKISKSLLVAEGKYNDVKEAVEATGKVMAAISGVTQQWDDDTQEMIDTMIEMGYTQEEIDKILRGHSVVMKDIGDTTNTTKTIFEDYADTVSLEAGRNGKFYLGFVNIGSYAHEASKKIQDEFDAARRGSLDSFGEIEKDSKKTFTEIADSTEIIGSAFSDLLGKGFMGELETFADLWEEVWQDLAKSMTGIIGDALEDALEQGGTIGGIGARFWDNFKTGIKGNELGSIVGGAGMWMAGREQGGGMGAVQGALGGMMAGAGIGTLIMPGIGTAIGAAIGAVVGGISAWLGGSDDPRMGFTRGAGGFNVTSSQGQGMTDNERTIWEQQLNSLVGKTNLAYRSLTKLFGDTGLFDLVGALGDVTIDSMEGTAQGIAAWIADVWLPAQMETVYGQAISRGLSNLGLDEQTISNLFDSIGLLPSADRLDALQDVIEALVMFRDIFEDFGSGGALLDLMGQSPMEKFADDMQSVRDQIDLVTVGWENMSLPDRAAEAQQIGVLFAGALQTTLNMLQQIESVRQGINQSFNRLDEDLRVGGMGQAGKERYFRQRIVTLTGELGEAESAEEIARITAEIQRYIQSLTGIVDLDATGSITGGDTWREFIRGLIADAQEAANDQLDIVQEEILAEYDALILAMQEAEDALTGFTAAVDDANAADGAGGGNNPDDPGDQKTLNITIIPDQTPLVNFIWSVVDSRLGNDRSDNSAIQ